jgi:hypothetical protein
MAYRIIQISWKKWKKILTYIYKMEMNKKPLYLFRKNSSGYDVIGPICYAYKIVLNRYCSSESYGIPFVLPITPLQKNIS